MGVVSNGYVQCQECGNVHKLQVAFNIENKLYMRMKCPRCRGGTQHLWVGDNPEDVYLYGNIILDERFYQYHKTKQND